MFFKHNFAGHSYNPVAARGGQILEPCVPKKASALEKLDFCESSFPYFLEFYKVSDYIKTSGHFSCILFLCSSRSRQD